MKRLFTSGLCFLLGAPFIEAQTTPTYNDNVACILYTNCTPCHHDGGIGPFPLMNYDDATSAGFGIVGAVNAGNMPPWPPDPGYNRLAHERVLTQEEIDILNAWVNGGMPEGGGTPPMAPVYGSNEVITNPDLTLTMQPFTNFVNNVDLYQCFVLPTGLTEDMYVSGFEVVPGNGEMVHHVLVFADTSDVPLQLDAQDPNPGYTGFGGTGSSTSRLIGIWVPGEQPYFFPQNMGTKLLAGTNIIFQMHYPAGTGGQVDQTKINFDLFQGSWNTREVFFTAPLNFGSSLTDGPLIILPNQIRDFHNQYTIPNVDLTVLAVGPHMHLIGTSIKSWAVTPQNQTIPFFDIPEWDFHYQGFYQFRQPIRLPANTVLYGEATYDNTSANPNNPNDPPQLVTAGEATTDEMFLIYFAYTYYLNGDENIVIDTSTVKPTYNDCVFNVLGVDDTEETEFAVYPNPTSGLVQINMNRVRPTAIRLHDVHGKIVREFVASETMLNLEGLSRGVYLLSIETEGGVSSRRISIQ
ncbi:MAG: T9SS type A sorting domain-containing protein [Flavobacteriales bacterium]|nr:T9SS type A sorting domain-containing protein [Flavobacteriales bacterium]